MVDFGYVTCFLVYHESFLLSSTKLLKLIDMGQRNTWPSETDYTHWLRFFSYQLSIVVYVSCITRSNSPLSR